MFNILNLVLLCFSPGLGLSHIPGKRSVTKLYLTKPNLFNLVLDRVSFWPFATCHVPF